ncbi:MAG: CPBP family intramembrane metalloprotease [Lentisphaerae bacterium]|nr:CPBP family intramembrane metalloprotease [Lentisphaerota bacterium]
MTTADRRTYVGCWASLSVAALLFTLIFTTPAWGFWLQLSASAALLAALAFVFDGDALRKLLRLQWPGVVPALAGGLAAACVMYGVFYVGRMAALQLVPGAHDQIGSIYGLGRGVSRRPIGFLLLLIVGPCEEIFWRGYVQRRLCEAHGRKGVLITILLYTWVHVASGNPVLLLAALVCGTFWGLLFFRFGRLPVNMVSHGVWAALVFAVFPLT